MPPRSRLSKAIEAAGGLRPLTARRAAAARVAAVVPASPEEAESRLRGLSARLAVGIEKDLARALARPGAYGTIQRGLEEAERRALAALERSAPTVRGAVAKTLALAKKEYRRLAGEAPRKLDAGLKDLAVRTITEDLRRAIRAQFEDLRAEALSALSSGRDLPAALKKRLWVVPNRGNSIARTQIYSLYNAALEASGDSEWSVWVTRADERVRAEHRRRHLRRFRVAEGLGGIWPGQEIACRCISVPEIFLKGASKPKNGDLGSEARTGEASGRNNRKSNLIARALGATALGATALGATAAGEEKLTDEDVAKIFSLRAEGRTIQEIAVLVGRSQQQVSKILRGRYRARPASKKPA